MSDTKWSSKRWEGNYERVIISYKDNTLRALTNVTPEELEKIKREEHDRVTAITTTREGWMNCWSRGPLHGSSYVGRKMPAKKKLINVNVELIDEQESGETQSGSAGTKES